MKTVKQVLDINQGPTNRPNVCVCITFWMLETIGN